MIKIVPPWYFSPLVWHALQLSAMSATDSDVRHTMWSTSNTIGFGTLLLSLPKSFISTDLSPLSRYLNSSTRECGTHGTGDNSYLNTERSWMFRCCPMMKKRANKASYTIKKELVLCASINYTYSYITWCLTTLPYSASSWPVTKIIG